MKTLRVFALAMLGVLALQEVVSQNAPREQVGPLPEGGFLLNSGWKLQPAGQQVPVDTLPMSMAVSNDHKYLLVLNGGYNPASVSVIDIAGKKELGRTALPDAWLGLAVASGDQVYVGGGSSGKIYELRLTPEGALTRSREFTLAESSIKGAPFVGDVELSPDGRILYAADLYGDSVAIVNIQAGQVTGRWKTGRRPYRIVVTPDGAHLLISSWGDAAIYEHESTSGLLVAKTRTGPHPTDMLWLNKPAPSDEGGASYVARLFVTAGNTNSVYVYGLSKDSQLTEMETINVSTTPMHPLGMTPSALAVDGGGNQLYVACSDANAIAVADISAQHTRVLGFIPSGWYPTAVQVLPGDQLAMLNGKGLGSHPNPKGPNPAQRTASYREGERVLRRDQYVGSIQTGTVAFLPQRTPEQISEWTRTVLANSPYRDELIYGPVPDEQVAFFSRREGHEPPIQHVIYIIKENRTYDQVLGDMEKGNGDKSLTLFGEQVTPNLHQLARDYILYDNFYENADVSADGHNWATAAIAPDYTQKLWPSEYGRRSKVYDFEGGEPANTPPAGYLWNNAFQAGLTVRNYGEWASNIPLAKVTGARQIQHVEDPALLNYTDLNFRSFDLDYPDVDRAKEFIREWNSFDAKGEAPRIIILRMPNDHTAGTRPGSLTPVSYAADNDYGMGMIVDAVSHGKLWPSTAIFVIEDDAQNGPDHVDSHRAPAWVISPYTRRGITDSTMYNQASVLRTMEMIEGLRPLTHFDAGARPMFGSFSRTPDARPYTVIQPKTSVTEKNPANGPGAKESARMNFSNADLADDDELNDVIWRAIKHSDPPAPVRSAFAK